MLTSCRLIAILALGAVAAPALHGQTPADLARVCTAVSDVKLGQWSSFDASSGGKLRLAVVGSERSGDSTFYWFEVNFAGKDPNNSGVVQILAPGLAAGTAGAHAWIIKWGAQPAMRLSSQMVAMMGKKTGQNNFIFDWAGNCNRAHVVGWESVTVPAGTVRALHVTAEDGADVWASSDVPFGLVKLRGTQGDLALTGHGMGAKSSITEKPLEMPGMMMPPSKP
jgi:hypothetical protein